MAQLQQLADVVIFDSAPVLVASDTPVLATTVDGVLLVAWANRTRRDAAQESIKRLNNVGANILGGVLNSVPERKGRYGYYYSHSYNRLGSGKRTGESTRQKWWQRLSFPKLGSKIRSRRNKSEQINQRWPKPSSQKDIS
jgi:Mrp family chromosome partitioning ATPase